jgi:hypothetical protein
MRTYDDRFSECRLLPGGLWPVDRASICSTEEFVTIHLGWSQGVIISLTT